MLKDVCSVGKFYWVIARMVCMSYFGITLEETFVPSIITFGA